MKRIQEKVKDLIEVRGHKDFRLMIENPGEALFSYHFTEMTSSMLASWLDAVASTTQGSGHVRLVAGNRGIGKSHLLSAFSAIVSQTEIRARIPDSRVAASAQLLRRRRYPVGLVRRGSGASMIAELRTVIAEALSVDQSIVGESVPELLRSAAGKGGDLPFVLVIDSEVVRHGRTRKEDGEIVSEIIKLAPNHNIFLAVALDNDLAVNTNFGHAAANVRVDFLDEESLYPVIDGRIFPKSRQGHRVLSTVLAEFRRVIPNFRWTEQRFSSVYPLHPVAFEVAPAVRSYAPDFSLLTFASDAGTRILGRPAASLITLDELFDNAEASLRAASALSEAFHAYDSLNSQLIASMPVMERLQAKLVLKALLLLSLEGAGASAHDVSSSLMIYDERDADSGARLVGQILERYSAHLPEQIIRTEVSGRETRYRLKLGAKEDFNKRLEELAAAIPDDSIPIALKKAACARFDDLAESDSGTDLFRPWSSSEIEWRGSLRTGKIFWMAQEADLSLEPGSLAERSWDWAIVVKAEDDHAAMPEHDAGLPIAVWTHAALGPEEQRALKLYLALIEDSGLSREFGDRYQSALYAAARDAQRIWEQAFVSSGSASSAAGQTAFAESAHDAQSFAELLSTVVAPQLDLRYPEHPFFEACLRMSEVAIIAGDMFGGSRQSLPEVQRLAAIFAEPLGLVTRKGPTLVIESESRLLGLTVVRDLMNLIRSAEGSTISLRDISARLRRPPIGLAREAHFLVMAALVAARKIEFVTARGDRIGRRSLDLGLKWDDIVGITVPELLSYPKEKLAKWVQLLTGDRSIVSIEGEENQEAAIKAVGIWLADWNSARLLERYGELPDDILNDRTWRLFSTLERTFGSIAKTAEMVAERSMPLGDALNRVADAFADDEQGIEDRRREMSDLEEFILGASLREKIWKYLAISEPTSHQDVEWCRKLLTKALDQSAVASSAEVNLEIQKLWNTFQQLFIEHFVEEHDSVMKSRDLKVKFDSVVSSEGWWEFESLSRIPIFSPIHWNQANSLRRLSRHLECRFDARRILEEQPFCACSFSPATKRDFERLPENVHAVVEAGRASYREVLAMLRDVICETVENLARNSWDDNFKSSAVSLITHLNTEGGIPLLGSDEISVLKKAVENIPVTPMLNVDLPRTDFVSRSQLRSHVSAWLDNLPEQPVLLRV